MSLRLYLVHKHECIVIRCGKSDSCKILKKLKSHWYSHLLHAFKFHFFWGDYFETPEHQFLAPTNDVSLLQLPVYHWTVFLHSYLCVSPIFKERVVGLNVQNFHRMYGSILENHHACLVFSKRTRIFIKFKRKPQ